MIPFEMRTITYKLVTWSIVALMVFQFMAPQSAQAIVAMHCAGASTSSKPCAQALVSSEDVQSGKAYRIVMAGCRMPCCQSARMSNNSRMGCCKADRVSPSQPETNSVAIVRANRACHITLTVASNGGAVTLQSQHRILIHSARTLAPPAHLASHVSYPAFVSLPVINAPEHLSSQHLVTSHGLRAPPAA